MRSPTVKHFDIAVFGTRGSTTGRSRNWRKNETIFASGDRNESMFYIEKGLVKLTMTCARGREAIFCVCGKGDFFGQACVAGNQPVRLHNAIALTNATIVRIERSTIVGLLEAQHDVCYGFISYILELLASTERGVVDNLLDSSESRLTRALALFKSLDGKNGGKYAPRITQQTLSEMIGTTRQRVNVLMMKRAALNMTKGRGRKTPKGAERSSRRD